MITLPSPLEQSARLAAFLAAVTGYNYQSPLNGAPAQKGCRFAHDPSASAIRGTLLAILSEKKTSPVEKQTRSANEVVIALSKRGQFYFHADLRDFKTAMFFDSTDKVLRLISSDEFLSFVSAWTSLNRADRSFAYIEKAIQDAALSGPNTTGILPENYWASRPGVIYLSNGDGRAVRITAAEIAEVDNGTDGILFPAGKTLAPWSLVDPADPFVTCRLFAQAHCSAAHGKDLLRLWMYSLPTNPNSKPPLCAVGPVGSGKTRTVKGIAELFGIPFIAQKYEADAEDDFWPAINAGGIFCLDNVDNASRKGNWLADSIANAATDGCSQRRLLYTNDRTITLRARSWLAVTTANPEFASDAGLADRLMVIRMDRHKEDTSDTSLSTEIADHRNSALSHIVHTLHGALSNTAPTPHINARHPDFAATAVRIGRALNREADFIAALKAAETDKSTFCLENDPIGAAILSMMKPTGFWQGGSAALLDALKEADPDIASATKHGQPYWNPKRVAKRLTSIWPHIIAQFPGSSAEKDRKGFVVFTLSTDFLF